MSEETNTAPDAEAPSFGVADLVFTLQVYEAAAARGAFRAEEMTNVGAVYDRLRTFLIANGAVPNPATAEAAAPTTGEQ
jgi:hypothetical protein